MHDHDPEAGVADAIPADEIRELSRLEPTRSALAIAAEWAMIGAAVALGQALWGSPAFWLAWPLLVAFIGGRQHALAVIGHDGVHWRLAADKRWNDAISDLLLWWPLVAMTEGFRRYHGPHHRFLNTDRDGNIAMWGIRDAEGRPSREWTYPKTPAALLAKLCWRGCGLTGIARVLFSLVNTFRSRSVAYAAARMAYYAAILAAVHLAGAWAELVLLWLVPLCTWFVFANYVRLICEHSCVRSEVAAYAETRTTVPTWLDVAFLMPRNIGYHYAHHAWPSVPFYRLPELHQRLLREEGFRRHAHVTRGALAALAECVRPRG
jgi:fatty acid desaturase